ncbi:NAD/NADP octopine/nopaline dehydrogenase family protein [Clostridium sp.]|uniref:NAD/NADP octopine/nopaline dehydrogenase family protein n=1 Tax=Clostridium sp. TaxID=1506 RepID=UPI002613F27E|nr:NAD/NADP octopine/nopaline dehydrogenase family protein [uncultured Clostridium sp.]
MGKKDELFIGAITVRNTSEVCKVLEHMIQFYNEWTDECSEMLIATDEEVHNLCLKLGTIDLKKVGFIKEYFGADSVKQMTAQISGKPALKNIQAPLIKTQKGYIPDFNSRYFA